MRNNNAVNRSVRRDGNSIDDPVNRSPQIFQARDQREIEVAAGEFLAKRGRVIEIDSTRPTADERARIKIFNATDAQPVTSLRVNELGLDCFGFPALGRRNVAIIAVALHRNATRFANGVLESSDGLLLWRLCARHVEDFFFHDSAMQVVHAVSERDLRQRQSHAHPIRRQVIDVIQIDSADGKIA